eukprot:12022096-Alexandrium_andersonii.AAC.1
MSASLVGSEMCIRDRSCAPRGRGREAASVSGKAASGQGDAEQEGGLKTCLLYTSDAADDM